MNAKLLPAVMMFSLSVICIVFIVVGLIKALRKTPYTKQQQQRIIILTIICIAVWMGATALLALAGFFTRFSSTPPRVVLLIAAPLPFILIIAFSKKFAAILKTVPPCWLIAMQVFRIPVELLLLKAYTDGLLPKQMTFEGWNFDILSGVIAIPVAIMLYKKYNPLLAKAYNLIGLLLLLNILVIAVLSMPTALRVFMNEPANTIVAEFPFIYLPGVLVVIAYSLHIFSLRQIFITRNLKHEGYYTN